jgi:sarcosine oxidase, subunit gamma
MAEAVLQSPFDGLDEAMAQGSNASVRLAARPAMGQIGLRLDPSDSDAMGAVGRILDIVLPVEPNHVAGDAVGGVAAFWLGPDEWLVVAPEAERQRFLAGLGEALAGRHAAVVDQSAARGVLRLSGPRARDVLAKGCRLDLHPGVFKPGQCAQTALARALVLICALDETPSFDLYVRPSFAHYLTYWLLDAMAEYGLPELPGLGSKERAL